MDFTDYGARERDLEEAYMRNMLASSRLGKLRGRQQELQGYRAMPQAPRDQAPLASLARAIGGGFARHRAGKRLQEMAPQVAQAERDVAESSWASQREAMFQKWQAAQRDDSKFDLDETEKDRRFKQHKLEQDRRYALDAAEQNRVELTPEKLIGPDGRDTVVYRDPRDLSLSTDPLGQNKVDSEQYRGFGKDTGDSPKTRNLPEQLVLVEKARQLRGELIMAGPENISKSSGLPLSAINKKIEQAAVEGLFPGDTKYEKRLKKADAWKRAYVSEVYLPLRRILSGMQVTMGEKEIVDYGEGILNASDPEQLMTLTDQLVERVERQSISNLNYSYDQGTEATRKKYRRNFGNNENLELENGQWNWRQKEAPPVDADTAAHNARIEALISQIEGNTSVPEAERAKDIELWRAQLR